MKNVRKQEKIMLWIHEKLHREKNNYTNKRMEPFAVTVVNKKVS